MESLLIRIIAGAKVFRKINPYTSTFLAGLDPNESAAVLNLLIKEMGGLDEVLNEINITLDVLVKKIGSLKEVFKRATVTPRIVVRGRWVGPIYRTLQERLIKEGSYYEKTSNERQNNEAK